MVFLHEGSGDKSRKDFLNFEKKLWQNLDFSFLGGYIIAENLPKVS